jgi:thiol-disulfide isomerase/thioredoxin
MFFVKSIRSSYADGKTDTTESEAVMTQIQGSVRDPKGASVEGVRIRCVYYKIVNGEEWAWGSRGIKPQTTDKYGKYAFFVPSNLKYGINAGGIMSTSAVSRKFIAEPNEVYQVEDIIVRPANNSCTGRVLFENGQPAANLSYGYVSNNFSLSDTSYQPKTNNRGEFVIEHILSDELFSFWIFPKENTLCVWKRLEPNSRNLEFTLKTSEYIELPVDWFMGSTHEAIARAMPYAKDSRIQFCLPDLHGNTISLEEEQFKNKAVLVNICGSWCGGCRLELPYLVNFKNKYKKEGLEIIGIAFESGSKEEQLQAVKKLAQEFKVNYPLLIGGIKEREKIGSIINGLELFHGYPTTVYIGRDGLVKHIQTGFWLWPEGHKQWQIKQMEDHIKSLLGITVN